MVIWQENKPEPGDIPNAELCSLITSNKVALRTALEHTIYWSQSSGLSAGVSAYTDQPPGSARAYYGTQSQVSATSVGGKLMVTSDTKRLFGLGSTTSWLLGSRQAIIGDGQAGTFTNNVRRMVQSGSTVGIAAGATIYRQDFPVAYTGVSPIVQLAPAWSGATQWFLPSVVSRNASGFSFSLGTGAVTSSNSCTVYWYSDGTLTL